jgi:hypothetical protein
MRRVLTLLFITLIALTAFAQPKTQPPIVAKPDAFPTLVNPACSHCVDEMKRRAKDLKEDDPVLCWTRGYSEGGAIPIRFFLSKHRVISDSYGLFVYDPDAGFARGFAPSFNFVFHGWQNGVMVIKDTKDGTLYSALTGLGLEGPKKGERLKSVPTLMMTWGAWLEQYPHAVAYQMPEKYQPVELPKEANPLSVKTRPEKIDTRLKPDDMVIGVVGENGPFACPISKLVSLAKNGEHQQRWGLESRDNVTIVYDAKYKTAAAYQKFANQPRKFKAPNPDKDGVSPPDEGEPLPAGSKALPRIEMPGGLMAEHGGKLVDSTGSEWDVTGRAVAGKLKDWTLTPADYVVCKWAAWSAEYPRTHLIGIDKGADPTSPAEPKTDPDAAMKQATGSAELLKLLPKPFATLKAIDLKANTITLLLDGEKVAKVWPVEPDAEVKIAGFWGRLDQFKPGQHVWVWLKLDRKKNPVSVIMLADERSEEYIHNKNEAKPGVSDARYEEQVKWLRQRWTDEGLPGTVSVQHVFSGEVEVMIDHEGMRWARSLKYGDIVHITADPPIKAVVKSATPWRERTQLRLVVGELSASELKPGERVRVKMQTPGPVEFDPYPPDIDRPRSKEQRIEWFLASTYCVCKVKNDTCTGHFYTLASCNPNGCGAPDTTRKELAGLIDKGLTDKQIWDDMLKEKGELMLRPHLLP